MKVYKQSNIQSLLKHFPQSLKFQHPNLKQFKPNTSFSSQSNSFRQNKIKTSKNSPEHKNNIDNKIITEEKENNEASFGTNDKEGIRQKILHQHYKKQSNYLNFANPLYKHRALSKKDTKNSKKNTSNSLSTSLNTSMPIMLQLKNIKLIIPFNAAQTGRDKKRIESSRISKSKGNLSLTKGKSLVKEKTSYSKMSNKKKSFAQTTKNTRKNSLDKSKKNTSFNQPIVSIKKSGNDHKRGSSSMIKINSIPPTNYTSMCSRANSNMKQVKENSNSINANKNTINLKSKSKGKNKLNNTSTTNNNNNNQSNSITIEKTDKPNSKSKSKQKHSKLNNSKIIKKSILGDNSLNKNNKNTSNNSPRHLIDNFKHSVINKLNSNTSAIGKILTNLKKKELSVIKTHHQTPGRNVDELKIESTSLMSTIRDSSYYLKESESLSNYIKDYSKKNKEYPNTNLSFYKYGRIIGRGAFGKVNLGLNILTGQFVAIKSFNKKNIINKSSITKKKIMYETNLMRNLKHPYIVKILETFDSEKYILIIMEYISGGNLHSFVKKRRKLNEKTAKILFKQIIEGIKYIHSKNIVHRDIKLENILIDLDNNIKLCDFGVGKLVDSHTVLYDQCGTPIYMAPEIMKNEGYEGFPVDIWSSGIALYIMLSGNIPFNRADLYDLQYAIINHQHKPIDDISKEANEFLNGLLEKDPSKRLTPEQILKHPWLDDDFDSNGKSNMNKYHLFTYAEMVLLSKNHVDYRYGNPIDLTENFTMRNLITIENENHQNINTKSNILAPYNSCISDNASEEDEIFTKNFQHSEIPYGNDLVKFRGKAKELNMNYEQNNNEEIDNGILIDKDDDIISKEEKNEEKLHLASNRQNNHYREKDSYNLPLSNSLIIIDKLIQGVAKFGYSREYVIQSLEDNNLCSATAAYYLLLNFFNLHSS